MGKRVIIVDTSNEIAGDSDIPHFGIGRARRMQVAKTELQHQIMLEAVENHMPQVIIIDEIGTELEALAARTIAEKGVQLVGTTHGNCLDNLIKNPPLTDLIGGIQYVTLSDEEAKRRKTQKTILERKAYPAFQIAIEINEQTSWTIHEDIKTSIDLLLRGTFTTTQVRHLSRTEKINIKYKKFQTYSLFKNSPNLTTDITPVSISWVRQRQSTEFTTNNLKPKKLVIYPYSLSNNLMKEVILKIGFKVVLTKEIKKATIIIGLKKHLRQNYKLKKLAKQTNISIYAVKQNSVYQVIKLIQFIMT